jgi:hypothetical protein
MCCGQLGVAPTKVALSQRLGIECCSLAGNSHVEAPCLILQVEKISEVKMWRLTVEP